MSLLRIAPLLLVLASGCIAHRSGESIRAIRFEVEGRRALTLPGNPISNRSLRAVMSQSASSWPSRVLPGAIEPEWLDRAALDDDAAAIERWLAEHGSFDATLIRWEVTRKGRSRRGHQPVVVLGHLDPGPASRLRKVEIVGLGSVPRPLRRRIRAETVLVAGEVFSTEDYLATTRNIMRVLAESGYAFAKVDGVSDAFPNARAVDVTITVEAGPLSRYGPVTLTGVEGMPTSIVERHITLIEGQPYDSRALSDTRGALFGLRVFSVVNVTPNLDAPETALVPITIHVENRRWRHIEAGPGVRTQTGKPTLYGAVTWEHTNLAGRLWQTRISARAGVAGVLARSEEAAPILSEGAAEAVDRLTIAPVTDVTLNLVMPSARRPAWSLETSARLQVGIEPGYRFFSPELAPVLVVRPLVRRGPEALAIGFGYKIRYFDYFDFTVVLDDIVDSPLGLDLTDPYLLSMLDQHITWDGRDDAAAPRRGTYASWSVAEAGGPVGGNFNFIRTRGDVRAYRAVPRVLGWNPRTVLAGRLGAGAIVTYGAEAKASVPYAERLYLGGGTTVRGWGFNRLGPSVEATSLTTGVTESLPAGGLLSALGNLEVRTRVVGNLGVVVFSDMGRVWPEIADLALSDLQVSVGGGVRYATAVGPIRADVGFRLSPDSPELPSEPGWSLHFGIAEAF